MAPSTAAKKGKSRKLEGKDADERAGDDTVRVKKSLLTRAIKALVDLNNKKSANSNPLFGATSDTVSLYFTMSQVPDKRRIKPAMIPLPHPMYDDKSEICFFSKDPQKQYKELLLQKHPIPGLTKVIGIDKLRRNYKTFDTKRQLADAFDLFLCDTAIAEFMPKLLGQTFARKKKLPLPVRFRVADPEEHLKKAINGTPLRIPTGDCLTVRVGRITMNEAHLVANAVAIIGHVAKHLKQRDNPILSISAKTTDSPALPVWRRPIATGKGVKFLDLKKYHSDTSSSAASDTGRSGASTSGASDSDMVSDAGETLSTRDSISELDTASELEAMTDLDAEAGDVDDDESKGGELPLAQGLKDKKRRRDGKVVSEKVKPAPQQSPKQSPKSSPKQSPKMSPETSPKASPKYPKFAVEETGKKADAAAMPPPAKKMKTGKASKA